MATGETGETERRGRCGLLRLETPYYDLLPRDPLRSVARLVETSAKSRR